MNDLVTLERWVTAKGHQVGEIHLSHPERCNALTPQILNPLCTGIEKLSATCAFLLISGRGPHFSTGGDVAALKAHAGSAQSQHYAHEVVGTLHRAILSLRRAPALVFCAASGATTGGSAGLLLASDVVILRDDAFLQPYYREVGFAPDVGWTALLPDLIGPRRAMSMQIHNRRLTAQDALDLGLADKVVTADPLQAARAQIGEVSTSDVDALLRAKALIWDARRLDAVTDRLMAEERAFAARLALPTVAARMEQFMTSLTGADV